MSGQQLEDAPAAAEKCPHPVAEWVLAADENGRVTAACGRCGQPLSLDEDDEDEA